MPEYSTTTATQETKAPVKPKITENSVPAAFFKEDAKKARPQGDTSPSMYLSREKGSALHPEESEYEAYQRVLNTIFNKALPHKNKYDRETQEALDAYEGIMRLSSNDTSAAKVFPIVFMIVDSKVSTIVASKPKVIFDMQGERAKLPFIEKMYNYYTSDSDEGIDLDVVDYLWHWYNELVGWSVKRIWWEVEQRVEHVPEVERDEETDEIVMDEDGFAKLMYSRRQWIKGKVKQRVYMPDQVVVDPNAMFIHGSQGADYIVFMEDIPFDEWSQMYRGKAGFENTEKVEPGIFWTPTPTASTGIDPSTNQTVLYNAGINLEADKVRHIEWYCLSRDEYYVVSNGHKLKHVPNPTPPVNGRKVLPAVDLHARLRPGVFYSRPDSKVVEPIVVLWQRLLMAKAKRAELAGSPVILTDSTSSLAPKSFRVVPGAHWRGMKGRVETLNLAGVDTGEADKYIDQLKLLCKSTIGLDFERFIAEPDPTAQQQLARDSAMKLRTDKDSEFHEKMGHVKSAEITLAHLLFYIPIPEVVNVEDMDEDEKKDLEDWDAVDETKAQYYKYAKIPVEDVMYIENYIPAKEGEEEGKLDLCPYLGKGDRHLRQKARSYFLARPEFVRTKLPIKVRVVSNRKRLTNAAVRLEFAERLLKMSFELPPKNADEIANFQPKAQGDKAPDPEYYINREKAVREVLIAYDYDPDEFTQQDAMKGKPAQKLLQEVFKGKPPTIGVQPESKMMPSAILSARVRSKAQNPQQGGQPLSPAPAPSASPAGQ